MANYVQFTLTRTQLAEPNAWDRSSWIMRVDSSFSMEGDLTFGDDNIFLFRRVQLTDDEKRESDVSDPDPTANDVFVGVCSVKDMQTWGTDSRASTTFYRGHTVELMFRNPDHMEAAWTDLHADVSALQAQMALYEDLVLSEESRFQEHETYVMVGSSSSSAAEGYHLTRSALTPYPDSGSYSWRMTITCEGLGGWQSEIFKHLRQFPSLLDDTVVERPMGVASPTDLEEFPKDAPDDIHFPRLFLKNTLDLVTRDLSFLQEVWDIAIKEVRGLWRAMKTVQSTEDAQTYTIGTLPVDRSSSSSSFPAVLAATTSSSSSNAG